MITFQREIATWPLCEELKPLLALNNEEVPFLDWIAMAPDFGQYLAAEKAGLLRVYTAREGDQLVGYQIFSVFIHPHYVPLLCAKCNLLFLLKNFRGHVIGFMKWTEEQLTADGVGFITHENPDGKRVDVLYRRRGYKKFSELWGKRLE